MITAELSRRADSSSRQAGGKGVELMRRYYQETDPGVHAGGNRRAVSKEGNFEVVPPKQEAANYRAAIKETILAKPAKFLSSLIKGSRLGGEDGLPTKRQLDVLNTFREQRSLPRICCKTREPGRFKSRLAKRGAEANARHEALAASRPLKPPTRRLEEP